MESKEDLRLTLSLRTSSEYSTAGAAIDIDGSTHHRFLQDWTMREKQKTDEEDGNGRKKLRLSNLQSSTLENAFKLHHTLNPKEKVALAKDLKLRPRQVEVWFQNRRARKKLKKTEVDCEMLRRYCENLSEENRRLQRELMDLKAPNRNTTTPINLPMQITTCPSCQRRFNNDGDEMNDSDRRATTYNLEMMGRSIS